MEERFASGFDPFVIPFLVGMAFVLSYCLFGMLRIFFQLPHEDRRKFLISLVTPGMAVKNVWDIFCNCLLHVKLWKRNARLGYLHSSIAFGWFMLIFLGHVEVLLFVPGRINLFYYPIFFNFFVAESQTTLKGSLLFFLMDFFLLVVLSGITLAIIKRVRSTIFGMRRTTKPSILDRIGLYSLWSIFPLRWIAETFTAHISGGSFMTVPMNWLLIKVFGEDIPVMPFWWAYSIALCVFMCVLPFTRYMHIPAEIMLIPLRNAGIRIKHPRRGFATLEVYSCPNCGVCIDACPMSVRKANTKDCTVYLNRQLRRGNEKRIEEISDKCLLCGKCEAVCQVGVEGPRLRVAQRATRRYGLNQDYSNIDVKPLIEAAGGSKVLYFSGCMSQLTPKVGRSVESILRKAGVDCTWMDRDGGLCCGRPMLTAGRFAQAKQIIRKNEEVIMATGADTLILSCPICYKIFTEHYNLPGVRVVHYSKYIEGLVMLKKISLEKSDVCYVYHDPCELGRGAGIYEEPRKLLAQAAGIAESPVNREESICCGGSLGSLTLDFQQREAMTRNSLENLYKSKADAIATACPLCLATFSRYSDRPVKDLAEIVDASIVRK